jgi:hypothetical protein
MVPSFSTLLSQRVLTRSSRRVIVFKCSLCIQWGKMPTVSLVCHIFFMFYVMCIEVVNISIHVFKEVVARFVSVYKRSINRVHVLALLFFHRSASSLGCSQEQHVRTVLLQAVSTCHLGHFGRIKAH